VDSARPESERDGALEQRHDGAVRPLPRLRCWLLGSEALLAECGEILLRGGHEIRGVVTRAGRSADWALSRGLRVVDAASDYGEQVAEQPFDCLFAITHLAILPERLLRLPLRGAINFHDGPLPDYAGLNAPAWALMNGASRYGVTWHCMTGAIDAGAILERRDFAIAPDETTYSLNAKCFESAIDSFEDLLAKLVTGTLSAQPQDLGRRRYFERHRRPPHAGAIDWTRSAAEIEACVRALDYGRQPNPLGLATLEHAGQAVVVRRALALAGSGSVGAAAVGASVGGSAQRDGAASAPGTVLDSRAEVLRVACANGAIDLSDCADLDGRPLAIAEVARRLELRPGTVLEPLTAASAARLSALDRRMSRAEPYWVRRLRELDPIELPIALRARAPDDRVRPAELRISVPAALAQAFADRSISELLVAAWCGYLARLARRSSFDLAYADPVLRAEVHGLEPWVATRLPLRVRVDPTQDYAALVERIGAETLELRQRGPWLRNLVARTPELGALRETGPGEALSVGFASYEDFAEPTLPRGVDWTLEVRERPGHPVECRCVYDRERLSAVQARSIQTGFVALLDSLASRPGLPLAAHALLARDERERQLVEWNRAPLSQGRAVCVHESFEAQVERTPDAVAIVCDGRTLSYAELDARADALASELGAQGVRTDALVGVCVERSIELVVAVLGTLKAGAAFVPLEPTFPTERLAFMIADARLAVIVTTDRLASVLPATDAQLVRIDRDPPRSAARRRDTLLERSRGRAAPTDLAYAIYTSGTTGRPKGVLVEHRNVASFFAAIDQRIPHDPPGTWLALTSLSFDISVLELLWTLTRGFKVILHSARARAHTVAATRPLEFSLFYFASDAGHELGEGYRLLLEGARFADANDFSAVWTPERHFHAFGGLYPNPAVTSAALAAITRRVAIRAGSVVLPLHHPIRVAEDWALVDNLSNGRVGISFASGWHPRDFVLAPHNHGQSKQRMFDDIELVRRLWRGEAVAFPGADGTIAEVRTLPRPVQPELPVWIASAGNVETYAAAGRSGANLLTHLLGQSIDELAEKLQAYRAARAQAGLDPAAGTVTLMVHTFVGTDEARTRELVRQPLERYLESSLALLNGHLSAFPAFRRGANASHEKSDDLSDLGPNERAALIAHARERYYEHSGMFGTPERCLEFAQRLRRSGVDEIACLIDFGVPVAEVLACLPLLARVRARAGERVLVEPAGVEVSLAAQIRREQVTHLQCTPSLARILCSNSEGVLALGLLQHVYVGGEALSTDLAGELVAAVGGAVTNMYGPTETTVWSTTHELDPRGGTDPGRAAAPGAMPIGRPLANSLCYVLGAAAELLPIGVVGELHIGGAGVARGYLRRPELDAERFLPDPFAQQSDARMYRTGDLVRYRPDGVLEFLGRTDDQIKIRGHRVEPGEIEAALARAAQPGAGIAEVVVIAREDAPGDQRLVAYIVARGPALDPAELRDRLKAELPEYMVPTHFVFLEQVPRTHNGKLDRKALRAPENSSRSRRAALLPVGELETQLTGLWRQVLGVESVGVEDNFFDLGGHSLLVVRIHRRLRELGHAEVALTDLFRHPTIRSLARALESEVEPSTVDAARQRGLRRRQALPLRRLSDKQGVAADSPRERSRLT
jgi:natural product biosynthesis luciferase-like monooxygenase protein